MINKSDLFSKCLQTLTTSLHLCPGPSRQHLFLDWCGGLLTGLHDSSILTLLHSSELSRQSSAFKMCFKKSHPDTTLHKTLWWHPISFKIKPNFLIICKVYAMSLWPHLFLFFSSSLLVVPSGWNAYPQTPARSTPSHSWGLYLNDFSARTFLTMLSAPYCPFSFYLSPQHLSLT